MRRMAMTASVLAATAILGATGTANADDFQMYGYGKTRSAALADLDSNAGAACKSTFVIINTETWENGTQWQAQGHVYCD